MHHRQSKPENYSPLIIIGAGGHAVSVANVALSMGYEVRYFVDKNRAGSTFLDREVIADLDALGHLDHYAFAIAIGDNASRERVKKELTVRYSLAFPALIHASAVISSFSNVGAGTVVMPLAVVGPNTHIGEFCIVNTRASIDHDCHMGPFSSLAPGVTTGGTVSIGERSAISIAAVVKHGVTIGHDTVVGANSYLSADLGNKLLAYGTPAKIVRTRESGDRYLK